MNPKCHKTLIDVLKHLYKLADDFPYSQLALALDPQSLFDLMRIFGGQSLYIPTVPEFLELVQYCLVEEIGSYEDAISIEGEILNGFTKSKYDLISKKLRDHVKPGKRRKKNNKRKAGESSIPPNGEAEKTDLPD